MQAKETKGALIKELKVDKPSPSSFLLLQHPPASSPLLTTVASASIQNAAACSILVAVRFPPFSTRPPFASFPRPALRHGLYQQYGRGSIQVARRPIPILLQPTKFDFFFAQALPLLEIFAADRLAAFDFASHHFRAFLRTHWLSQTLLSLFRLARCLSSILLELQPVPYIHRIHP